MPLFYSTPLRYNPLDGSQAKPETREELLADRITSDVARIAEECVKEIVSLEVLDPDEVLGPMEPAEAAKFLDLKYSTFKEIAPNLPRIFVTPGNPRYLRRELLEHFRRERGDFGPTFGPSLG